MILKSLADQKYCCQWIGNAAHELLGKFASLEYTCMFQIQWSTFEYDLCYLIYKYPLSRNKSFKLQNVETRSSDVDIFLLCSSC